MDSGGSVFDSSGGGPLAFAAAQAMEAQSGTGRDSRGDGGTAASASSSSSSSSGGGSGGMGCCGRDDKEDYGEAKRPPVEKKDSTGSQKLRVDEIGHATKEPGRASVSYVVSPGDRPQDDDDAQNAAAFAALREVDDIPASDGLKPQSIMGWAGTMLSCRT